MTQNKPISGVFVVERQGISNTVCLSNKLLDIQPSNIDYFQFKNLLVAIFDADYIVKILDALNSNKRLIIDFDNAVVKLIEEKDIDFKKILSTYFNPQQVQNEIDDPYFELDEDIYSRFKSL